MTIVAQLPHISFRFFRFWAAGHAVKNKPNFYFPSFRRYGVAMETQVVVCGRRVLIHFRRLDETGSVAIGRRNQIFSSAQERG